MIKKHARSTLAAMVVLSIVEFNIVKIGGEVVLRVTDALPITVESPCALRPVWEEIL